MMTTGKAKQLTIYLGETDKATIAHSTWRSSNGCARKRS